MNKEEAIRAHMRQKARPDDELIQEFMPLLDKNIGRMTLDDAWPVSQILGMRYWNSLSDADKKRVGEIVSQMASNKHQAVCNAHQATCNEEQATNA